MSFAQAVRAVLSSYVRAIGLFFRTMCSGRARRAEYWWFVLFNLLVTFAAGLLDWMVGAPVVSSLASLALVAPVLGVTIRRLHDTGRSGWWLLTLLLLPIGALVILFFTVQDGQAGQNAYGPSPKPAPAA